MSTDTFSPVPRALAPLPPTKSRLQSTVWKQRELSTECYGWILKYLRWAYIFLYVKYNHIWVVQRPKLEQELHYRHGKWAQCNVFTLEVWPYLVHFRPWMSTGESTPTTITGRALSESIGACSPTGHSGGLTTTGTRTTPTSFPSEDGASPVFTNIPVMSTDLAELTWTKTGTLEMFAPNL